MRGANAWSSPALVYTMADAVPQDALALVCSCINLTHFDLASTWLLPLRCVSRAWRAAVAVAVAVKDHPHCREFILRENQLAKREVVLSYARVFGRGCRSLDVFNSISAHLETGTLFLDSVGAGLVSLSIMNDNGVSADHIIELCRRCPGLKKLQAAYSLTGIKKADIHLLAIRVSAACPLLEEVRLPVYGYSPAETWARHFPNLLCLDFGREYLGCSPGYPRWDEGMGVDSLDLPFLLDRIERSATACTSATACNFGEETVVNIELAERLARTSLRSRLQRLDLAGCGEVVVSEATILYFAREFTSLVDLGLPIMFHGRLDFYESLCEARPELARLAINCDSWADDKCVRVVCERLRLEHLGLAGRCRISPDVVNVILESPCAQQTLKEADLAYIDFMGSYETLNFVLGCPNLSNLAWEVPDEAPLRVDFSRIGAEGRMDLDSDSEEESPEERRAAWFPGRVEYTVVWDDVDTENVWSIVQILKSRGGKLNSAFSGLEEFVNPRAEIPGTSTFTGP